jgi:dihydrofolate reductase
VNESTSIMEETLENVGAGVMGRNMFGPVGGGDWGDEQWTGWWGDNPPYHDDVFILTHHPREPVEMEGGTTYHFVTDGKHRGGQDRRRDGREADLRISRRTPIPLRRPGPATSWLCGRISDDSTARAEARP